MEPCTKHPADMLEAGEDKDGLFVLCSKCMYRTRDLKSWISYVENDYIVHPNSGTFMAADECYYVVTNSEDQIEALHEESLTDAIKLGAQIYGVAAVPLEDHEDTT